MIRLTADLGDSALLTIPLTWQGSAFTPGDDWGLIFTAKYRESDADADAVIQKASDVGIEHSSSNALVQLVYEDTATLSPVDLKCDIQAQHIESGEVRTVARNVVLQLSRDITRELETSREVFTSQPGAPFAGATFGPSEDPPTNTRLIWINLSGYRHEWITNAWVRTGTVPNVTRDSLGIPGIESDLLAREMVFTPESYGAVGDGTTDDTDALQECIEAAEAVRGKMVLSAKTYLITEALVISDAMQIIGQGSGEVWGGRNTPANKSDVFLNSAPYFSGSAIYQTTAATNGITIEVRGKEVTLRDFGIKFADAIKFEDTGHGIEVSPPNYELQDTPDNGVFGGVWSNVAVYGHDGNHYAFKQVNSQLMTLENLHSFGGGGFHFQTDCAESYKGNLTAVNLYSYVCCPGTSHGFYLSHTVANHPMNLMVFIRPQCIIDTVSGIDPPVGAQKHWKWDEDTHTITVWGADFEGAVSGTGSPVIPKPVNFPDTNIFHGFGATGDGHLDFGATSGAFGEQYADVGADERHVTIRGLNRARLRMGSTAQEEFQIMAQDSGGNEIFSRSNIKYRPTGTTPPSFLLENSYSSTTTPLTLGFDGAAGGTAMTIPFGDANHFLRFKAGGNMQMGGYGTIYLSGKHNGSVPAWADDGQANAAAVEVPGLLSSTRLRTSISLPTYANDAAADADSALLTKEFYKITGSRAIYQKP